MDEAKQWFICSVAVKVGSKSMVVGRSNMYNFFSYYYRTSMVGDCGGGGGC